METGSHRTVLVVDDDPTVRLLCRVSLEPSGFRVTEAADGYVTKPFDPAALAPTLTALLDRIERGEGRFVVAESLEKLRGELLEPPEGPDSRTRARQ